MKSNIHSCISRIASHLTVILLPCVCAISCSTAPSRPPLAVKQSSRVASAASSQWVKVRDNPPTWYPRGTPADCPIDHHSGEWLYTEDSQGTRFFIPYHGLTVDRRKALVAEALAARDPRKARKIAYEDAGALIGSVVFFMPYAMTNVVR
jgi:hypothetical protein